MNEKKNKKNSFPSPPPLLLSPLLCPFLFTYPEKSGRSKSVKCSRRKDSINFSFLDFFLSVNLIDKNKMSLQRQSLAGEKRE